MGCACRRDQAEKITPKQMLEAGLQLDSQHFLPRWTVIEAEAKTDLSPQRAPVLNDPATTAALINANAVVGMVAKRPDSVPSGSGNQRSTRRQVSLSIRGASDFSPHALMMAVSSTDPHRHRSRPSEVS